MKKTNNAVRGLLYGKVKRAVIKRDNQVIETIPYQKLVREISEARHNPEAGTKLVELTDKERDAIAAIIVELISIPAFDFADICGISETKAKRLLAQAHKALPKLEA